MRFYKLKIFLITVFFYGFCGQIFADTSMLQYPIGETAEITITEKIKAIVNFCGFPMPVHKSVGTIRMEVTLLDDGEQGTPIDVEVVVRDLHYSESEPKESLFIDTRSITSSSTSDETLALSCYICDVLIDQPLRFSIRENDSVIETSGILAQIADYLDAEDINRLSFGTSLDFFSPTLGQMFHLKDVPLKTTEGMVEMSVIDWFTFFPFVDNERSSRSDSEITDHGVYEIRNIKEDAITAFLKGHISYLSEDYSNYPFVNEDHWDTFTLNAKIKWDSNNALIQNRKLMIKGQTFLGDTTLYTVLKQKWVSCSVKK